MRRLRVQCVLYGMSAGSKFPQFLCCSSRYLGSRCGAYERDLDYLTWGISGEVQNFAGFYRGVEDQTKVEGNNAGLTREVAIFPDMS